MWCGARLTPMLLIVAAALPAQDTPRGPVEELLAIALKNRRDLAAIEQRVAEARGMLRQAGVRPPAVLEGSAASGRPLGTKGEESYAVAISRQFETAAKRSKRIQVAELGIAVAESELGERIAELRWNLRVAIAGIIAGRQKARTLDTVLNLLRESLRLTEARVREGDAARLEAELLRVEISRVEASRAAVAGDVEAGRLSLRQLAGLDPDAPVALPDAMEDPALPDGASIERRAIARRPDLLAARNLEQQSEAALALAEAESKPDVTISAGYTRQYGRFDDQLGISPAGGTAPLRDQDDILSAGISIPLTGRGRNLGNIEAAAARSRQARLRREHFERSIPFDVAAAMRRYEALRRAAAVTRDSSLPQAARNLETIRQAYGLGQLRLLDVLNEQRRLLDLELDYADSLAGLQRAMAELERSAGGNLQ